MIVRRRCPVATAIFRGQVFRGIVQIITVRAAVTVTATSTATATAASATTIVRIALRHLRCDRIRGTFGFLARLMMMNAVVANFHHDSCLKLKNNNINNNCHDPTTTKGISLFVKDKSLAFDIQNRGALSPRSYVREASRQHALFRIARLQSIKTTRL